MKICKIKSSQELALVLIESKNWKTYYDQSTNETGVIKSLNLLLTIEGNKVALGDDEIEIISDDEEDCSNDRTDKPIKEIE